MNRYNTCASCARYVKRVDRICPFCGAVERSPGQKAIRHTARLSRAQRLALASTLAIAGCSGSAATTATNPLDATAPMPPPRRHLGSGGVTTGPGWEDGTADALSDSGTLVIYAAVIDDGSMPADVEPPHDAADAESASATTACSASDADIPFAASSGSFPCGYATCDRATQWCYWPSGGGNPAWRHCRPLETTCDDSNSNGDAGCNQNQPLFCWNANCDGGLRKCSCVTILCGFGGFCTDDDAGGINVGCGECYGAPPARLERLTRTAPIA